MNWEWAKAQLFEGRAVVRESERRHAVEDVNGAEVRYLGREGVMAQAGFDINWQPVFMLIGTMSHVPLEANTEDIEATDWALE